MSSKQLNDKFRRRLRRKRFIRRRVFGTAEKPRLTVSRSHKNISCQLIDDYRGVTLAAASTLEKDVKAKLAGAAGNCKAASIVGQLIAEKGKALGIAVAQFDRNGYRFHGRVKALAEAAREAGMKL